MRLNKWKGVFEKGYLPNWTAENFNVQKVVAGRKRPLYKLHDYNGEEVKGTFYPEEIQPISDNKYFIQKMIKTKRLADGTKKLFVKWDGWPAKFNSWINEADIEDYGNKDR